VDLADAFENLFGRDRLPMNEPPETKEPRPDERLNSTEF
jgi:hypothetical protein